MLDFKHLSFWEKRTITEGIDFIVLGGGIVGISSALSLRAKYPEAKIVLLERGYLSTGASTKNAGFACFGSATELADDLENMSESAVWDTVNLRFRGLTKLLERFSPEEIGYQNSGSWDLIHAEKPSKEISSDQLAYFNQKIAEISGQSDCFSFDSELGIKLGFNGIKGAYHNRLEGEIRTDKLLLAFNRILAKNDIIPLYGINVNNIEHGDSQILFQTNFGELKSAKAVIAVNGFAAKLLNDNRIQPARAQVLVTSVIPKLHLPGTYHYDAGYYYFRSIDNRILLGGGRNLNFKEEETVEFGNTDQISTALTNILKEIIIPNTPFTIDYQWSGIMGVGAEKKPIIELIHPNVAIGVRMGGMGVAIGSVVGEEVAKLL